MDYKKGEKELEHYNRIKGEIYEKIPPLKDTLSFYSRELEQMLAHCARLANWDPLKVFETVERTQEEVKFQGYFMTLHFIDSWGRGLQRTHNHKDMPAELYEVLFGPDIHARPETLASMAVLKEESEKFLSELQEDEERIAKEYETIFQKIYAEVMADPRVPHLAGTCFTGLLAKTAQLAGYSRINVFEPRSPQEMESENKYLRYHAFLQEYKQFLEPAKSGGRIEKMEESPIAEKFNAVVAAVDTVKELADTFSALEQATGDKLVLGWDTPARTPAMAKPFSGC